jgi:hypothetical protein
MTQPTITDVFPGASQNATGVTIPWSAMPGITASATNNADKTIAGFIAACLAYYTEVRRNGDLNAVPPTNGDLDVSIIAEIGRASIVSNFDTQNNRNDFEEQEMILRFYKPRGAATFDPDDY